MMTDTRRIPSRGQWGTDRLRTASLAPLKMRSAKAVQFIAIRLISRKSLVFLVRLDVEILTQRDNHSAVLLRRRSRRIRGGGANAADLEGTFSARCIVTAAGSRSSICLRELMRQTSACFDISSTPIDFHRLARGASALPLDYYAASAAVMERTLAPMPTDWMQGEVRQRVWVDVAQIIPPRRWPAGLPCRWPGADSAWPNGQRARRTNQSA